MRSAHRSFSTCLYVREAISNCHWYWLFSASAVAKVSKWLVLFNQLYFKDAFKVHCCQLIVYVNLIENKGFFFFSRTLSLKHIDNHWFYFIIWKGDYNQPQNLKFSRSESTDVVGPSCILLEIRNSSKNEQVTLYWGRHLAKCVFCTWSCCMCVISGNAQCAPFNTRLYVREAISKCHWYKLIFLIVWQPCHC